MDIGVSLIMLAASAPLQALIALLIRVRLGRPVLFRQLRPGRDERVFQLVKFRTMRDLNESSGSISDEDRLTPLGALLRSTSLDELPTLWNVLTGDMSLVGPRPLLVEYLKRYSPEHRRRHEVRPGITGLAQVRGRNQLEWSERFRLDVEYVDRRSLRLDLRILVETVVKVIRREGISDGTSATMTEFRGAGS